MHNLYNILDKVNMEYIPVNTCEAQIGSYFISTDL